MIVFSRCDLTFHVGSLSNKDFQDWTEEELNTLLNNEVYRENNSIDYKVNFAPLEYTDNLKREKQAEFRKDVCSFANAEGGYIFYGIGENSGIPVVLTGILIKNPDRFELERRNELQLIQPVMPEVDFRFIPVKEEKYVVVLHIHRGFYKPYIAEGQEGNLHFYVRRGNRKQPMTYTEIRNSFWNAVMLSEDIKHFRKERLEEYTAEIKGAFALIHMVPMTFRNAMDYIPMFKLYKQGKINFCRLFNGMVFNQAVPNVDGVYFPDYSGYRDDEQLQIFNNGSVELKLNLKTKENYVSGIQAEKEYFLITTDLFEELPKLILCTADMYKELGRAVAMYICVAIVGCKGMWNYTPYINGDTSTMVDRNEILCMPIEIRNILDEEQVKTGIENCIQMTKYSLGIRI